MTAHEIIKTVATYVIALVVIVGGGLLLIIPTRLQASELLPFLTGAVGIVLGYVFGERSASAASGTIMLPPMDARISETRTVEGFPQDDR